MLIIRAATQPFRGSTSNLVSEALMLDDIEQIDVAAAYITIGGARDLLTTLKIGLGDKWPFVKKRWLTAFDYCRTDPLAIDMLMSWPKSTVKVHDASAVLDRNCNPRKPFHPKTFLFSGATHHSVIAGSGNISRSGLSLGHEVGLLLSCHRSKGKLEAGPRTEVAAVQSWFDSSWASAPPLTDSQKSRYFDIFNSVDNLRNPVPTDDDPPSEMGKSELFSDGDLRKLQRCSQFWIDAGNITKNRGPSLPGNQLMMRRLSRVFFGVPATDVPANSPLKKISVQFVGNDPVERSLTFSDNGMDKLTLPIPGSGGPVNYDGKTLIFKRLGPSLFGLDVGTKAQRRMWVKRSREIGALFEMAGGERCWGVF